MTQREAWASRLGLILAMAGNAVGLGNFLRFPVQAATNGGGTFMIPYITALLVLGIPIVWVEWSIGRFGGIYGHGTTPGMFDKLWKSRAAKYVGALGVSLPLSILVYYVYIESWTFGYSFFALTGRFKAGEDMAEASRFLQSYQGVGAEGPGSLFAAGVVFFLLTVAINCWVISRGLSGGIERLAKIAMPLLFLFAVVLVVRTFTLGTPDPTKPENNIWNGLGFFWNPDFSLLGRSAVWLAAAGQIFFTLSIGTGCIQTYASYLKKNDDVALSGLTTAATNEAAEVVLGGSIAIPAAVAFFGIAMTQSIAAGGSFNLGFVAMPIIFTKLPLGGLLGMMWFGLLFFAGITSSVALAQPMMAFLQDEFGVRRGRAALILGGIMLAFGFPIVFFLKYGYLDQYDYWIGTVGLVTFALIETIVFAWLFKGGFWSEINRGADIQLPKVVFYVIRFVVPLGLGFLLISWVYQDVTSPNSNILLNGAKPEQLPYLWGARLTIVFLAAAMVWLVKKAWDRKDRGAPAAQEERP